MILDRLGNSGEKGFPLPEFPKQLFRKARPNAVIYEPFGSANISLLPCNLVARR